MFKVSSGVLRSLDLGGAVASEVENPSWYLPSRTIERTIRPRQQEFSNYVRSLLQTGFDLVGAETLQAGKVRGFRPLSVLDLVERTVFRALTDACADAIQPPRRDFAAYDEFQRAPLGSPGTKYVVIADVAAFYSYVDHSLVAEEIVSQTGDGRLASVIEDFLHGVMQREFGLPQLYHGSDVLSEAVIDIVQRRLIREGYTAFRFNDDFRIASKDWGHAQSALERLDVHLRAVGLHLSDSKSLIETRKKYQDSLDRPEEEWGAIAGAVGLDVRDIDWGEVNFYDPQVPPLVGEETQEEDTPGEPDNEEIRRLWEEVGSRALGIWREGLKMGPAERLRQRIDRRLMRQALRIFRSVRSVKAISDCPRILRLETESTPAVAKYLRALAVRNSDAVVTAMAKWVRGGLYLSSWQSLWLMEPLLVAPRLPKELEDWVSQCLAADLPDTLRARASFVLARHGVVDDHALARLFNQLRPTARVEVAAAIGRHGTNAAIRRSIREEDAVSRWIVDEFEPLEF